jgi:hypothetical protein
VLYTRTCVVLWLVDKVAHATANQERSVVQQRQAKELAKRKRAVKMMIACVTLFFLCYAPMSILIWANFIRLAFAPLFVTIIRPLAPILIRCHFRFHLVDGRTIHVPRFINDLITLLLLLCSSVNPIVYAVYSTKFRNRLRKFWPSPDPPVTSPGSIVTGQGQRRR